MTEADDSSASLLMSSVIDESDDKAVETTDAADTNVFHNMVQATQIINEPFQILTTNGTAQLLTAEALQSLEGVVITVEAPPELEQQHLNDSEKIWQVIPTSENAGITHIIAVGQPGVSIPAVVPEVTNIKEEPIEDIGELQNDTLASVLLLGTRSNLPPDTPSWALKLRDCEAIGDSYRGWVASEPELDLILTFHKRQTHSYWGTRQSPSSSRQSSRLMWKSQYVPFDGIPFINAGSRAVVMECQYGPRRKGNPLKKQTDSANKCQYKQTCPARIYIKKVRKYPQYMVDMNADRKSLRIGMDHAFQELKRRGFKNHGEDRWYVQLPTSAAHEFHDLNLDSVHTKKVSPEIKSEDHLQSNKNCSKGSRMHPKLADKIRELVLKGERRVYAIRKQLRKLVEHGMFDTLDHVPERHNLSYFPTVHDIQNHIFETLKDLEGNIPGHEGNLDAASLMLHCENSTSCEQDDSEDSMNAKPIMSPVPSNLETASNSDGNSRLQTVTVTLTQPQQGEGRVISKIEAQLSDGTTQVSTTLTPDAIELLSRLHPEILAGTCIQLPNPSLQPEVIMNESIKQISVIQNGESDLAGVMLTDVHEMNMDHDITNSDTFDENQTLEMSTNDHQKLKLNSDLTDQCAAADSETLDLNADDVQIMAMNSGLSCEDSNENGVLEMNKNKKPVIVTVGIDGEILQFQNPFGDV